MVIWNKSYDRFSRRYRSKTVRAREPFDAKSVRAFAILCVRNVHMYSGVSNKRPGRLFFFKIFAFGTVIETGTLIFFPTFLESGTIIMLLSALVRLLGFEDCACETAVLKDCEQYDVQRKQPPLSKKKKAKK